jgi:hypothetical protein
VDSERIFEQFSRFRKNNSSWPLASRLAANSIKPDQY